MELHNSYPKIVAPAGNLEKLKVACLYGADAVYFGATKFNLRVAAENFSEDEIIEGVKFAHQHNTEAYLLLNNFLHDYELQELKDLLYLAESAGIDSFIVSDLGVLSEIKQLVSVPVTLSTQNSCANAANAVFWQKSGISKVVLAREVSILEAVDIKKQSGLKIEMFVHGAMCMGWSGNCIISNLLSGRDSNRGGCCHACRFKYDFNNNKTLKDITLMNSKDLCGILMITEFIKHKIDYLKIEGRMRSLLYVATITKAYRSAIDNVINHQGDKLKQIYQETEKIRHRPYFDGALSNELSSDSFFYDENLNTANNEGFVGKIIEIIDKNIICIEIKNPFNIGDTLEIVTFRGKNFIFEVNKVLNIDRNEIKKIKPNSVVLIENICGCESLNIIRKINFN